MHSLGLRFFAIASLLGGLAFALPYAPDDADIVSSPAIKAARSPDTCADPSLATAVLEGFKGAGTEHSLDFRFAYESVNDFTGAATWVNVHPVFKAWPTQQNFTSPLFRLQKPDMSEIVVAIGANAESPPIISGFTFDVRVAAWVYSSQVCGSVPLLSAAFVSATDNYYTTDPFVHAGLISDGWVDTGVVAYVLPLELGDS